MKYHFITSVNNGADYIEFVPIFIKHLYKIFPNCKITIWYIGDFAELPESYTDYNEELRIWKDTDNLNTRYLSQWVRMLACSIPDTDEDSGEIRCICDIDLLPLRNFFNDIYSSIKQDVIEDRLFNFGKMSVKDITDSKEVPMCWTFGTQTAWNKCLGINYYEEMRLILKDNFKELDNPYGYDWSSDQKYLFNNIGRYGIIIPRDQHNDRIDREQPLTETIKDLIRNSSIADYHMPRPYSKHWQLVNKILDFAILHSTSSPPSQSS